MEFPVLAHGYVCSYCQVIYNLFKNKQQTNKKKQLFRRDLGLDTEKYITES